MTRKERVRLTWFVNIATVCLFLGITLPTMRIDPGDGTLRRFILGFFTTGPSTYSVISSIWALIKEGVAMDIFLGTIIFLFSIILPTLKLVVFYNVLSGGNTNIRLQELVHNWGRFSMLDVYIVAILILAIRSLPGGAQIKPSGGLILFTISVLICLYVSKRLEGIKEIN